MTGGHPLSESDGRSIGFEQNPDVLVVAEGPDHRVVALNREARSLFPDVELVGRPLRESVGRYFTDHQTAEQWDVAYHGQERAASGWRVEVPGPDGVLRDRYLDFVIRPWHRPDGSIGGVLASGTDVTDMVAARRAAEARATAARARARDAHDVVTTLQDALLPDSLPVLPGLDLAASYVLAAEDASAGGDWFDAVVRPDGRLVLVVGDVVGHGVAASAVMGQLRAVLHGQLLGGRSVSEALADLDRFARTQQESYAATACVCEVDPVTGAMSYSTAGHPPPLVVPARGEARFLPPSGATPLATEGDYTCTRARLDPGDLLLLYTDGIIERPGVTPAEATVELSRVVTNAARDRMLRTAGASARAAKRASHLALEVLTRVTGHDDDITLLAMQRTDPIGEYAAAFPARPEFVRDVRDGVGDWLGPLEVKPLDDMAVRHAVGELVTNVVEHAYPSPTPDDAMVRVEAVLGPSGDLVCTVRDTGRWRDSTAGSDEKGRGLAIASGLVDRLQVEHDESGTAATLRTRLTRSARMFGSTAAVAVPGPVRGSGPPFAMAVTGHVVSVHGSVDLEDADDLRICLQRVSRGGTSPLTVDLAAVTFLGSAAVQVLYEQHGSGRGLTLVAPMGSVAQHVLDLVRLPRIERLAHGTG